MLRLLYCSFFVGVFVLLVSSVQAQFYLDGGESDSWKRKERRYDNFRIIYPLSADSLAQRVAEILDYNSETVRITSRRYSGFPIILRNSTLYSNGYVAWTPARMELYTLSAGESDEPTPWLTHLLSHELRHYAQLNALNWNVVRVLRYPLGEQALALASAVTPNWFFEGDAIYYESSNGRVGRLHSAKQYQHYRAEILGGASLSYDQHINGSYKYFVPNHYNFGSLMVEHAYANYGATFWPEVLNYTSWHLYKLFPFHFAIKKYTGLTRPKLFASALRSLDSITRDTTIAPEVQKLAPFCNQLFPHYSPSTQKYYYLQQNYTELQALYTTSDLQTGTPREWATIRAVRGSIRYDDTLASWVQFRRHPIWSKKHWGEIWILNLTTGEKKKLKLHTQALSPVPYAKLKRIRAIEVQPRGEFVLTERRMKDGELNNLEADRFRGMELRELLHGRDENSSVVRAVTDKGTTLLLYHWQTREVDTLLAPILKDISNISTDASGIYFSMSQDYVRRGFYAPWPTRGQPIDTLQQLYLSAYGNEYLRKCDDTSLLYSAYTVSGYQARKQKVHVQKRVAVADLQPQLLYPQPERYAATKELAHGRTEVKEVKPYSPLKNAIRVHSWAPFYFNPRGDLETLTESKLGLTVLSQNPTGTLAITTGYFYDRGHGGSLTLEWVGAWPRVWWQVYTDQRDMSFVVNRERIGGKEQYYATDLGLSFPYTWTKGMYTHNFTGNLVGSVNNNWTFDSHRRLLWQGRFMLRASLSYSKIRLAPRLALFPRLGFRVQLTGRTLVFPQVDLKRVLEARITGYLPGIGRTHSMRFMFYTAQQTWGHLEQSFRFSRRAMWFDAAPALYSGTSGFQFDWDYALPLAYPDWNVGSFFYLKRIYTTLFLSWRQRQTLLRTTAFTRVVGLELRLDSHFMRTQYPLRWGFNVSYAPFGDPLGPAKRKFWSLEGAFSIDFGERAEQPEVVF